MYERRTVIIESMAAGGQGLARVEGKVVFIPGVLPLEKVIIEPTEAKSGYLRANLLEVLEAHPKRINPPCPLYMTCGGCQLMHASYEIQPQLKTEAALEKISAVKEEELEIVPSPRDLNYRDRVRFQLAEIKKKITLGFHASGSRRLVPVTSCLQLNLEINLILPELSQQLADMPLDRPPTGLSILNGLPGEGMIVVLDFPGKPSAAQKEVLTACSDPEIIRGVYYSIRGRLNPENKQVHAVVNTISREHDIKMLARPGVFTQVNRGINDLLVNKVVSIASEMGCGRVLDLYSGYGNFSLPLARVAGMVVAVEENPLAVANARLNIKTNNIKNVSLIKNDAAREVKKLADTGQTFDLVMLDPPRSGARNMAPHIARMQPKEIIYISCHPAAMARDLAEYTSLGYKLESAAAYDMFPQTSHLEVMARLVAS